MLLGNVPAQMSDTESLRRGRLPGRTRATATSSYSITTSGSAEGREILEEEPIREGENSTFSFWVEIVYEETRNACDDDLPMENDDLCNGTLEQSSLQEKSLHLRCMNGRVTCRTTCGRRTPRGRLRHSSAILGRSGTRRAERIGR